MSKFKLLNSEDDFKHLKVGDKLYGIGKISNTREIIEINHTCKQLKIKEYQNGYYPFTDWIGMGWSCISKPQTFKEIFFEKLMAT